MKDKQLNRTYSKFQAGRLLLLCAVIAVIGCMSALTAAAQEKVMSPKPASELDDCQPNLLLIKRSAQHKPSGLETLEASARNTVMAKIATAKNALCHKSWELWHGKWIYSFYADGTCKGFSPQNGRSNQVSWDIVYDYDGSAYLGKGNFGLCLGGTTTYHLDIKPNGDLNIENAFKPIDFIDPATFLQKNKERHKQSEAGIANLCSGKWIASQDDGALRDLQFKSNHMLIVNGCEDSCAYWHIDKEQVFLEIRSINRIPGLQKSNYQLSEVNLPSGKIKAILLDFEISSDGILRSKQKGWQFRKS